MRTRTHTISVVVASLVTVAAVCQSGGASGDVAAPDAARIDAVFQEGMRLGTGGIYGYYLKPVDGAPIYGHNESLAYDVASEAKVILHLYGMRAVRSGRESLTSPVTVYRYPSLGENASSPGACAVLEDEVPANAETVTLEEAHDRMMNISDNRTTRALELRYGAGNLTAFAASIGMTSTRIEPWPGCGKPGPRTRTTLADLGTLYESVSNLSSIDELGRELFYRLMVGLKASPQLVQDVVIPEAEALGVSPKKVTKFLALFVRHLKGGGAGGCLNQQCTRLRTLNTEAGVTSIPFRTGRRKTELRDYVVGAFIADFDIECTVRPCPADVTLNNALRITSINEMLRTPIREALATWAPKKKRR